MFLSIMTLNNYDPTVWDGLTVPDGMDKEILTDYICMECSDLALVYPDLDIMKKAITNWSAMEQPIWQKLYDTTQLEYNPLWNVDATITEDNSEDNSEDSSRDNSGDNENTGNADNTESKKGFNDPSDWADHTKNTANNKNNGKWSEKWSEKRSGKRSEKRSEKRSIRRTGNIGVTSSQSLVKEQREVAIFNIYQTIADSFKKRFCLLVY